MKGTKPVSLTTARHRRNMMLLGTIVAVIFVVAAAVLLAMHKPSADEVTVPEVVAPVAANLENASTDTTKSTDTAKTFIISYYTALSSNDSTALYSLGQDEAAAAVEHGWLQKIGYSVDLTKLSSPSAVSLPQQQGIYAGCSYYRISDFYQEAPTEAISSDITGKTGAEGWIYYDALNNKWVISDPTIPTAVATPSTAALSRASSDGLAKVKTETSGIYSNAWWSYAQIFTEISNYSTDTDITVSLKKLDGGMTATIPTEIGTTIDRTTGGTVTVNNIAEEARTVKSGIVKVYRGELSNFTATKIGAAALSIKGNIQPLTISYKEEDIAPIISVGDVTTEESIALLTQTQNRQYNVNANNNTNANANIDSNNNTARRNANGAQ